MPENNEYRENHPDVDAVVAELVETLSMANPKSFTKTWIKQNCDPHLAASIKSLITRGIIADVVEMIRLLPPKWSMRWKPSLATKNNTDTPPEDLPEIKTNQPRQPNLEPGLLVLEDVPSYEVQDPILEGKTSFWANGLPRTTAEKMKYTKKQGILKLLNELLYKCRPAETPTPLWVKKNSGSLYKKIRRSIIFREFLDWDDVFGHIDKKWLEPKIPLDTKEPREPRRIIIDPKKNEVRSVQGESRRLDKPDLTTSAQIADTKQQLKEYENAAEVDSVLEPYKKSLYLFIAAQSKEDWRICDNICVELLFLAHHGNDIARKRLQELLYPVVHGWIDKNEKLAVYTNNWQQMEKKMDACFRNYNFKKRGSFTRYLFQSLFLYARGNQRQIAVSLDEKVGKHGRAISEIIPDESTTQAEADGENQE